MAVSLPSSRTLLAIIETLATGAAGGLLLNLLQMPAGFVAGSMGAVTLATLANRPSIVPDILSRLSSLTIGTALGAYVTADMGHVVSVYPLSFLMLLLATAAMTAAMALYLSRAQHWDPLSALLGAVPGAMSQIFPYAAELRADLQTIAISQTFRVVALTASIPLAFGLAGLHADSFNPTRRAELATLSDGTLQLCAGLAVCYVLYRLRFPGSWMIGGLTTSAVLHGTGLTHGVLPAWLMFAAMVTMGSYVGTRFRDVTLNALLRNVRATAVSFAIGLSVALAFAFVTSKLTGVSFAAVIVAFAPGGIDLMPILALAMNLDPLYVSAHHLVRILFISFALPLVVTRIGKPVPPE